LRSAPPASSHEAWACLKSCILTVVGSPAARTAGHQTLVRKVFREVGCCRFRWTQELLQLYLLEAPLRRLAGSSHNQNLVLKGGVLLAALGDRRPSKDVDLQARQLTNDAETTIRVICEIAELAADDGAVFDTEATNAELIREDDGYQGYRVRMPASLATANLKLARRHQRRGPDRAQPAAGATALPAYRRHHRAGRLPDRDGARREARHRPAARHREHPLA